MFLIKIFEIYHFLPVTSAEHPASSPVVMDFRRVPLSALRPKTRETLSAGLDSVKWIQSERGFDRDYRGLAEFADVDRLRDFSSCKDRTAEVLSVWIDRGNNPTFGDLVEALEALDRYDHRL